MGVKGKVRGAEVTLIITTAVAAAASVPFSLTSRNVLCATSDMNSLSFGSVDKVRAEKSAVRGLNA